MKARTLKFEYTKAELEDLRLRMGLYPRKLLLDGVGQTAGGIRQWLRDAIKDYQGPSTRDIIGAARAAELFLREAPKKKSASRIRAGWEHLVGTDGPDFEHILFVHRAYGGTDIPAEYREMVATA
jgi:hypothetical protein